MRQKKPESLLKVTVEKNKKKLTRAIPPQHVVPSA
jgi:hypothetical protein